MGTSHRHNASVAGQPNWGNASKAVTGIATSIGKLDTLENELQSSLTMQQVTRIQRQRTKYEGQIKNNYHHAVRNLIRAAGGRGVVSAGKSHAIGFAGVQVAGGVLSVFNEIASNGLTAWSQKNGITSLEGKTCKEVLDVIRGFIGVDVVGLDTTAANDALGVVMERIEEKIGDEVSAFETEMSKIMSSDAIKDIIDEFFGMYIYSHLSQDFLEKIEYEKGSDKMRQTMEEIKDQIISDIKFGRSLRPAESVDWSSEDGNDYIKKEFDRIIYILSGNED